MHRRGVGGGDETVPVYHPMATAAAADDDEDDKGDDTIRLDECFSGAAGDAAGDSAGGGGSGGGGTGSGSGGDSITNGIGPGPTPSLPMNPPSEPYPPLGHKRARTGTSPATIHWPPVPKPSLTLSTHPLHPSYYPPLSTPPHQYTL